MDNDEIIAILLIAMAIVLSIELMYILLKKKRKKKEAEMFRKPSQPVETMAEKAHNSILTVDSISSKLAARGINTAEADSIIREARNNAAARDYAAAIERAEAAKIVLLRLKRERDSQTETQAPPPADPERRPMDRSVFEPEEPVREKNKIESLPTNYLQAKFMLTSTKDLLNKKSISEGEAYDFYISALRFYKKEDYTKALSLAIKAERLLDSGTLTLIGEEKPAPEDAKEEVIEVLVCPECDSEIGEEDAFCRKCGENLDAPRECPECGTDYEPGDKFCRKCGHKLG